MEGRTPKVSGTTSAPIRTLIADSHGILVDAMEALLSALGDVKVVGGAVDGVVAVDLAARLRPDVALVGLNVPAMDGIETTRQIRKLVPTTRILVLSTHAGPGYVYQAFRAGADGYVVKEARAAEVIEALRRVSQGKRYMSESVSSLVIGDIATSHRAQDPLSRLTERERDVLRLTAEGKSSAASAKLLGLSPKTVESYRSRIMRKLEIHDITGLVKFAIRHGIASLDP
jgi:DNA-binding NarL/FixJ family response regulator